MGKLIDIDDIGLTDFEIVMCDSDYKEALIMLCQKIDKAKEAIVRCKNCKYCSNPSWLHGWNGMCTKSFCNVPEYHYCGYGERKPDE